MLTVYSSHIVSKNSDIIKTPSKPSYGWNYSKILI